MACLIGILLFVAVHLIGFVNVFIYENSKMASQSIVLQSENQEKIGKISIFTKIKLNCYTSDFGVAAVFAIDFHKKRVKSIEKE